MSRERFMYLVEACGTDKERMAELAILLTEASIGVACMESAGAPPFGVAAHAIAILAAIDELQVRVRAQPS